MDRAIAKFSVLFSVILISQICSHDVLISFSVPLYHLGYTRVSVLAHKSMKLPMVPTFWKL